MLLPGGVEPHRRRRPGAGSQDLLGRLRSVLLEQAADEAERGRVLVHLRRAAPHVERGAPVEHGIGDRTRPEPLPRAQLRGRREHRRRAAPPRVGEHQLDRRVRGRVVVAQAEAPDHVHVRPRLGAVLAREFAVAEQPARDREQLVAGRRRPQPHVHRLAGQLALRAVGGSGGSDDAIRLAMGLGRAPRVLHRGGQIAGLQLDGELAARLAQLVTTMRECDTCVAEASAVLQHAAQHQPQCGALARFAGEADRRLQVRDGVGEAGGRLRPAELGEHGRAFRIGGRLAQRPLEVAHGGGAARPGPARAVRSRAGGRRRHRHPPGRTPADARSPARPTRRRRSARAPPAGGSARARRAATRCRPRHAGADE